MRSKKALFLLSASVLLLMLGCSTLCRACHHAAPESHAQSCGICPGVHAHDLDTDQHDSHCDAGHTDTPAPAHEACFCHALGPLLAPLNNDASPFAADTMELPAGRTVLLLQSTVCTLPFVYALPPPAQSLRATEQTVLHC